MSRLASTRRTASKLPSADSSKSAANSKPPSTLDQLTSELAGLRIADKKGKQRQASDSESSPEARKVQAMKAVNASSQSLSKFAQSGWKRSKPSRGTSLSDVKKCITEATKALTYLRGLDEGNLDIEKSASSLVGKLISMEMVSLGAHLCHLSYSWRLASSMSLCRCFQMCTLGSTPLLTLGQ